MPNWVDIFRQNILGRLGPDCTSTAQLVDAVGKDIGESVSVDALFNAHKRHRERLNLKPSLMDYMNREGTTKQPRIKPEDISFYLPPERWEEVRATDRFIITCAMNNVSLDGKVWESVLSYAEASDAVVLVVPSRYRNPTTPGESKKVDDNAWWPTEVVPYMTDEFVELHEHLWLMSHVRVQATAVHPLSGLEALSRGASAVFGHAQLAMRMVPTPQNRLPKVLYTTGSVSEPNYSDTRAGTRGDFHHGKGALVVERDGPRFHVRAVVADDKGGFYDLDKYYSSKGVKDSPGVLALITGDEHAMFNDPKCRAATYTGSDSITATLKPKKIVRHDVFDAFTISHHKRKDPLVQYAKHKFGHTHVMDELELTVKFLEETTPKGATNLIVSSNHHDFLLRWLKEVHAPTEEPWNVDAWLELWGLITQTVEFKESGVTDVDPFALWTATRLTVPTEFLPVDSEADIVGILVGMHGHLGPNGARGSISQFSRIGAKTVVAHCHTPGIRHGCYQVGTSSRLRLDYNKGPSSWAHCHCAIHPNGKRQLIFVVDGHWRKA